MVALGVEDRDRGVGERGRVDDEAAGGFACLVDPVDDFVIPVALMETRLHGKCLAIVLDIGQCLVAVDVGLAFAQQIEVGAIQDVDQTDHWTVLPRLWWGPIPDGQRWAGW